MYRLRKTYKSITMKAEDIKTAFMQSRELTDEEWMAMPKEEILKLYKNCYSMLMVFIKQKEDQPSDEDIAIEIIARYHGNSRGLPTAKKAFIDGALWMRDGLIKASEQNKKDDIPLECRKCEYQNSKNCNTCDVLNSQFH